MNNKNILVPNLPESISDATIAVWHKKIGDNVEQGEILLEIETDKIMLEIPAEESGILTVILENVGSIVTSGQILGELSLHDDNENNYPNQDIKTQTENSKNILHTDHDANTYDNFLKQNKNKHLSPSIRRLIKEYNLEPELISKNDPYGRITRESIEQYLYKNKNHNLKTSSSMLELENKNSNRTETRVPMNRLRQRMAERLLDVKQNTAMLTTFNEVNMKPIINLRKKFGDTFEQKHGIRLGFMSFFVKAVLAGLESFPEINASIDGEDIVYHNYFDISIAVSTSRGLVTPVLRNINLLNISEIEKEIKNMAKKGRDGKLKIEELSGGNFTITNGGIFGSLMSTPIINPPQSAILGMHAIIERPMVVNDRIEILPMMYLALSYDHRLIDGKDSVGFLIKVKNVLEDPMRFLLNI